MFCRHLNRSRLTQNLGFEIAAGTATLHVSDERRRLQHGSAPPNAAKRKKMDIAAPNASLEISPPCAPVRTISAQLDEASATKLAPAAQLASEIATQVHTVEVGLQSVSTTWYRLRFAAQQRTAIAATPKENATAQTRSDGGDARRPFVFIRKRCARHEGPHLMVWATNPDENEWEAVPEVELRHRRRVRVAFRGRTLSCDMLTRSELLVMHAVRPIGAMHDMQDQVQHLVGGCCS